MEWARRGFVLGLGSGLILASLILGASQKPPSEREIKLAAEKLGMVMREEIAPQDEPKERVVERVVLTVPTGIGWSDVAQALERAGLIKDRASFLAGIKDKKVGSGLRAGVYILEAGLPEADIVDRLTGAGR